MPDRPLLSIRELAAHLGVPETTVRYWHRKGVGPPAIKIGKHLRFRPVDVDRWLAEKGNGEAA